MPFKKFCRNVCLRRCQSTLRATVALIITLITGYAVADDTEVFFGSQSQPNVLLVIDVSGSMSGLDGGTTTRLDRLKAALNEMLAATTDINVGLMAYNGVGNHFIHAIKPITENRDALLASINGLTANNGTPTVMALHDAKLYFSGEPLSTARRRSYSSYNYSCIDPNMVTYECWGNPPKIDKKGNVKPQGIYTGDYAKVMRLPDPDAYTLGPVSVDPALEAGRIVRHEHCTESNLDHESCSDEEIVGAVTYNSPITSECQSNHIVLLTDGAPVSNSFTEARADLIQAEIGITACQDLLEVGFPAGGRCGADLARHMATTDFVPDSAKVNNVITHTIGLELVEEWPWLSSLSEGLGLGGGHYPATSAQSLIDAFESIVGVAETELSTFVAPAISVDRFSGLSHRDDVYLALFKPSAQASWEGNLKRYSFSGATPVLRDVDGEVAIDPATGTFNATAKSWWSTTPDGNTVSLGGAAGALGTSRNVYTHFNSNDLTDPGNAVHEDNAAISAIDHLEVPTLDRSNLLQWARGVDVLDYDEDPTTTTRKQIGDPLHSQPVLVTYGKILDSVVPESVAFFGTNQGYLHAIDTETGLEVFSFIPSELLRNLKVFYSNKRRASKLYGLDGDLTTWIQDENKDGIINGDDTAYLYVGMRRGGNNYYALDVTDKTMPKHLWKIKGGPGGDEGFEGLGQSWSKPTLQTINISGTATKVLIFAGGYDPMQDNANIRSVDTIGNTIFIVNAKTGALIWKAATTDYPEMVYSIPSDLNVIDIDGDGLADQIYVGDMGGQVWRFDFNKAATTTDDLVTGGVIASLALDASDGLRRFFYPPDIALIKGEGTTSSFLSVSIGSGNRAHPLDKTVEDRFYMIRQHDIFDAPAGYGINGDSFAGYRPVTEADLYDATNNNIGSTDVTISNTARAELDAAKGWMLRLTEPGEKVLSQSLTASFSVNFTTYLPDSGASDICSASIGSSRLYRVSVRDATPTNSGPPEEVLDLNDPNRRKDRYSGIEGGGIASAPYLYFDPEGGVNVGQGTGPFDVLTDSKQQRIFWSEEPDG